MTTFTLATTVSATGSQMKTLQLLKISKHISLVLQVDNNYTHGLNSGRQVAVRRRNATRRRSSSVKMVAPLTTYTKEEQLAATTHCLQKRIEL